MAQQYPQWYLLMDEGTECGPWLGTIQTAAEKEHAEVTGLLNIR